MSAEKHADLAITQLWSDQCQAAREETTTQPLLPQHKRHNNKEVQSEGHSMASCPTHQDDKGQNAKGDLRAGSWFTHRTDNLQAEFSWSLWKQNVFNALDRAKTNIFIGTNKTLEDGCARILLRLKSSQSFELCNAEPHNFTLHLLLQQNCCRFIADSWGLWYTCRELPIAIPKDNSILFFVATTMAAICSQAFPAMGRTIIPMKAWCIPAPTDTSKI
jgi:hypothetical protein